MRHRLEFEVVKSALLNRNIVPSFDICDGELRREEQCLLIQGSMSHDIVFLELVRAPYAAQRGKDCDMLHVQ